MVSNLSEIRNLSPEKRELLNLLLKEQGIDLNRELILPQKRESNHFPLSFAQQRLWFLAQFGSGSSLYNIPTARRLTGPLNVQALERSLNTVIQRHESLRTTFEEREGSPVQVIAPSLTLSLDPINLQELPEEEREAEAHRLATVDAQTPFDLQRGPLLRAALVRLTPEDHLLLLNMHHIISDGWSMAVLLREMAALYAAYSRGEEPSLPDLPVQYVDYALWQRNWLEGGVKERQLEYWKSKLGTLPPALALPTDHPRPPILRNRGDSYSFTLPTELATQLKTLAQEENATYFMILLAAFKVLLHRYTGQKDLTVGTPIANRERQEIENLIGFFVNTLVIRTDLSGEPSFRALLREMRETTLEAYENQDLPFEMLVEALQPKRDMSRPPLFQVMFVLQNTPKNVMRVPELTMTPVEAHTGASTFDMTLLMSDAPDGRLQGTVEYSTDLFEAATIERMMRHLGTLLEGIVADPDQAISRIPLLGAAERRQMLIEWNATTAPYPRVCAHELFEAQVERTPDETALIFKDQALTYRELNRRANQVAHYLQDLGVEPDDLVGFCTERSVDMIIAIMGILKAGAAYVPLDPGYPLERLTFMIEDAGVSVLLTHSSLLDRLPPDIAHVICLDSDSALLEQMPADNPASGATPDNLAYIIYTSGSTGRPKGVLIEHGSLINLATAYIERLEIGPGTRVLQFFSASFDGSVADIFMALLSGGTVCLVPRELMIPGPELNRFLREQKVESAVLTPSALAALPVEDQPHLKTLATGGEACTLEIVRRWAPGRRYFNVYGPTETTVISSWYEVEDAEAEGSNVPIGRPLPNTQLYILDTYLQPVPIGVTGELYIGGDGVARGYHNRPALTRERFVDDPFSDAPGARMYKTGDLARYRSDRNIEFLGRIDHQVKVRGFRIELGEIETHLREHPALQDAVVVVREDTPGDKRLVAYVIPEQASSSLAAELRDFIEKKLPHYMVPAFFISLESLPLTPVGKIDRDALPAPEQSDVELRHAYVAPRTPVEEMVAGLFAQVLSVEQVGIKDNFFDLGGHSLLATQLTSRVREAFHVTLPLREVFENPTVAGVASAIEHTMMTQGAQEQKAIEPVPRTWDLPLSFAQQRLWFLDQLEPGNPLYNIPDAVRIQGPLEVEALRRALDEIVARHEVLRTTFPDVNGKPYLNIEPEIDLPFAVIDLTSLPQAEQEAEVERLGRKEALHSFDLAHGPLLRVILCKLSPEDHVLILTMHHIISDGWSMGVLVRELVPLYKAFSEGKPSPLSDLPIQYADFAYWQRQWLEGENLEQQLAYWKEQLEGAPAHLDLPTDRPRPDLQRSEGAIHKFDLSKSLTNRLQALSQETGTTLFMTLLAAWQALLARYSEQDDISVGTPIANRNRTEIEPLIGFFVNTLTLRTDLSGDPTFTELLQRVRDVTLGAYAHQDLPFEMLVNTLQPDRDLRYTPLFQVMFMLQNAPMDVIELPDLTFRSLPVESGMSMFDITLAMEEVSGELKGFFEYNTDLFDAETIQRMGDHFHHLLEAIVADPEAPLSHLSLLTDAEARLLLETWNDTTAVYPRERCVHELFETRAAEQPDAVAAWFEDQNLTYDELNRRSNRLARYLRRQGVEPDTLVGLCMDRSFDLLVGLLGILKAGGAYVPLDPAYPVERLDFMLTDSGAEIIVTQERFADLAPFADQQLVRLDAECDRTEEEDYTAVKSDVTPEHLAYVIYTSGSTGRPKGVMVSHRSVVNHNVAAAKMFALQPEDRVLQFSTINFDAAVEEIFPAWWSGASLVLLPEELPTAEALEQLITRASVTVLDLPTAYWHMWVSSLAARDASPPDSVRLVAVGGEKASAERYARWRALTGDRVTWWNTYGPTEGTIIATAYQATDATLPEVPIGRPIDNVRVYVLDPHQQPVPIGVTGELWIGGEAVARGYLNRPQLNEERFVADPFSREPEARMYRTGDRVRYLPDGNLEFIGRVDHQVKVRGFRVEMGGIETVLRDHLGVQDAAVIMREDGADDATPGAMTEHARLVAYIVPNDEAPSVNELREHLTQSLPDYMVPSAFVTLDALPLTLQGKVDRKALPAPEGERPVLEQAYVAPRTPEEETLAEIWAQVLGLDQVGVKDNFFELGGDSILGIQVVARANQAGLGLTPKQIFEHPTVAGLARVAQQGGIVSAEQGVVEGPVPLTPIQHWFFKQDLPNPHNWRQTVLLEVQSELDPALARMTIAYLLAHHDALRLRFQSGPQGWEQFNAGVEEEIPFIALDLSEFPDVGLEDAIETGAAWLRAIMNLTDGPLIRAAYLNLGPERPGRLLFTVHHLAIDGVSWRILLEDFQLVYSQLAAGEEVTLPPKTTSYRQWARKLVDHAQTENVRKQSEYWLSKATDDIARLPLDFETGENTEASAQTVVTTLDEEETEALLSKVPAVYHTQINDVLLTALARVISQWIDSSSVWLTLESHGREPLFDDVDLSRTVGWFTVLYPVRLDLQGTSDLGEALMAVKEQLRQVPDHGIGYGLLRYLSQDQELAGQLGSVPESEICFNYLGQFDAVFQDETQGFTPAEETTGPDRSLAGDRGCILDINGGITGGRLQMVWSYSENLHRRETIERLAEAYTTTLRDIIAHCRSPEAGGYTPSDFPMANLDQRKLDKVLSKLDASQNSG